MWKIYIDKKNRGYIDKKEVIILLTKPPATNYTSKWKEHHSMGNHQSTFNFNKLSYI